MNTLRWLRLGHTPTIIAIYGTYSHPSFPGTGRWDTCHISGTMKNTHDFIFSIFLFGFVWLYIRPRINLLALGQSYDLIAPNSSDGTRRLLIKESVPNQNKIGQSTNLAYFLKYTTMRYRYNSVKFLHNPPNCHCKYIFNQNHYSCLQYHAILFRVITAPDSLCYTGGLFYKVYRNNYEVKGTDK